MADAIRRWITDAKTHPEGARHLAARADWVEAQLQTLAKTAELNLDPPAHLDGLTAWDLSCALGDLRVALTRLRDCNS